LVACAPAAAPIGPVPAATLLVGCGEVNVEGLGTEVLGLLARAVAEEPLPHPQLFQLSHVGCDQLQAEPVPAPVAERQPLPVQTARPAHIATTSIHRENETRMASDPSPGRGRIVRRGKYSNLVDAAAGRTRRRIPSGWVDRTVPG
jgi:hypothetical protein